MPVQVFHTTKQTDLPTALATLDLPSAPIITMEQIHAGICKVVNLAETQELAGADACLTALPGVVLQVKHADCLPVLLYHPSGVIGAVHAGRKGTQQQVLQHTLQMLKNIYGVKSDLEVWFGPAICEKCYQINRETDEHYNLIEQNRQQLLAEFPETSFHLKTSNDCTCHQPAQYHSYRREGKGVPMNYSGIVVK